MLKIYWIFAIWLGTIFTTFPQETLELISCSICLETPEKTWPETFDVCKLENTTHSFCTDCIHSHITKVDKSTCPLCRKEITFGMREQIRITKNLND